MFQQVTNLRFSTDQGKWKPEIPVYSQAICLEGVDKDAFPQTYLSALDLSVFPSPDGTYLTPTQAVSDPLYELSLDSQALIFKEVKWHCDLLEPKENVMVLKRYLLHVMGCKKVFTDEERTQFQIHDFKMKLLGRVLEDVEQKTEEELAEKNLKIGDENFLVKFIEEFHSYIFDKGYFTPDVVEYYVDLSRKIDRFKDISRTKKKGRTAENQKEVADFKRDYPCVVLFEESPAREHFTKFSTVESYFSQEAHDSWGQILSGKPNIIYVKPPAKQIKTHEVRSGFLNALKCWGMFLKRWLL